MSIELQMVIVFGFFILLLMIICFYMIRFPKCVELKLLYVVLNIVSLLSLLVYIFFLYKQSSPIICGIIDYVLKAIQDLNFIHVSIFYMFSFIFFALCSSPMIIIVVIICSVLNAILFGFLFLVDEVYDLVHKFIHWLRNLFNSSKNK